MSIEICVAQEGVERATISGSEQRRRPQRGFHCEKQTRVMHSGKAGADLVLETSCVPTMESLCMREMEWVVMQHQAQSTLGSVVQDGHQPL